MANFGIFKGFSDKLFEGELPTNLGFIGSINVGLLLDSYSNAAAAYSLRKLRSAYTGSAIRVRRSSDNTEQDIGFTALGALDTTSLTTFCGSGNGFVTSWYDQSGNARNATQTTAANQPQIVSSGSIILENGKPSISFDGSNDCLFSANVTTDIFFNSSIFSVLKIPSQSNEDIPFGFGTTSSTGQVRVLYSSGGYKLGFATWARDYTSNLDSISSSIYLYSVIQNNTSVSLTKNNTTVTGSLSGTPSNTSSGSYSIGTLNGGQSTSYLTNMVSSEFIFYGNDQSSNRSGIESNINTYYGIY